MKRFPRFLFMLWLVIGGTTGSPQPCFADPSVTLRPATEVHSMIVRLSDVFDGIPAGMDHDIAQAPAPGKQVTYDINVLNRLTEKYGLDWKSQSLADHAVISTACTHITSDMISKAVAGKIRETTSRAKAGIDVTFDNHTLQIDVPSDEPPEFTLNNFTYDALSKRFRADLVIDMPDGPYSLPVSGRALLKRSIPVLARRLEGGTIVGLSDIEQIEVPEERVTEAVAANAGQLIGHELRHDTDGGQMIYARDMISPRLVSRGALVTLKIETPFMMLTAQGKSLQDGGQGDVVRVINTQSNRMIEGTVDGPGVVRVQIAQKVAANP